MKGTCFDLYNSGFLKEGFYYIETFFINRCKKILFFKIPYKTKHQRLLLFKSKIDFYRFDVIFDNSNSGFCSLSASSSRGALVYCNFKPLKKIYFK